MRRPVTPRREPDAHAAPIDHAALDVVRVVRARAADVVSVLVAVALGRLDADAVVLVLARGLLAGAAAVDSGMDSRRGDEEKDGGLHRRWAVRDSDLSRCWFGSRDDFIKRDPGLRKKNRAVVIVGATVLLSPTRTPPDRHC
jgi:hypothetical protein